MFLEAVKRLYEYQREMNHHLLDVCSELSSDELTAIQVEGQPSVRDTLVHMIDVIHINVAWWNGRLPGESAFALEFDPEDYPSVESLRSFWASTDAEVYEFIRRLSEQDLERKYQRTTPEGELRVRVLWEMMLHVINHGTQHRSEVALMLTKLGHSPGDMEIL